MRTSLRGWLNTLGLAITMGALCAPVCAPAAGLVAVWGNCSSGQNAIPQGLGTVKAVAAGGNHSLALRADGIVVCLGWDPNCDYGQFSVPLGLSNVTMLAAGQNHNLALKSDGRVVVWGSNESGQTNIPGGLTNVMAVAAGTFHSLALKADGTVAGWGDDQYGQCGRLAGLSNVIAVAVGLNHSLALMADGTVAACGQNSAGQCLVPAGLSNVTAVAAGDLHSLALRADGTVLGWGANWQGQIEVPPGLSNVTAIAAGANHSLALRANGTVVAWGQNDGGQGTVPPGLANVTAIAAGLWHNVAIASEGPLQILGNPVGQVVPWRTNVTFSVTAAGAGPLSFRWLFNGQPLPSTGRFAGATSSALTIIGAEFADIGSYMAVVSNSFGSTFSTAATLLVINPPIILQQPASQTMPAGQGLAFIVTADGTPPLAYQWLFNGVPAVGATASVFWLTNVQSINAGSYAVVVSNAFGSVQSSNTVLAVTERAPFIARFLAPQTVLAGHGAAFSVLALGSSPMTYQWRRNGADLPGATDATLTLPQVGFDDGGYYNVVVSNAWGQAISAKALLLVVPALVWRSSPAGYAPTNIPPGLTNLTAIAAGDYHIVALKADGTVATWINGPYASAGLTNVPSGLTEVTAVAAGGNFSLALKASGTVVAWGSGSGTNVPGNLSGVTAIAAGYGHGLALRTNGLVTAWGASPYGETNVPPFVSKVVSIAAGQHHSLALMSDGAVFGWGSGATEAPSSLTNPIAIACGGNRSLALQGNGTLTALNYGAGGIPAGLSNVVAMATSNSRSVALKADGSVVVFPPDQPGSAAAALVASLTNVVAVSAGGSQTPYYVALAGTGFPTFTVQPVQTEIYTLPLNQPTEAVPPRIHFNARAVGVQPMSYQWQLNGQDLPGATQVTLILTNAQGKDAGAYRLIAANALGRATSSVAILTIPCTATLAQSLNATNQAWTTGISNTAWFPQNRVTHDGVAAAQSGPIGNGQQSYLQTTVTGPGTLRFWWKVSSEEGFDFLRFYQDGYSTLLAGISGEVGWERMTFSIPAGSHTLKWVYVKDPSVSDGQDAAWVDEVSWGTNSRVRVPQRLSVPVVLPDGSLSFRSGDSDGGSLRPEDLAGFEAEASTNLAGWLRLTNALSWTNGSLWLRDPDRANYPRRFYRVFEH